MEENQTATYFLRSRLYTYDIIVINICLKSCCFELKYYNNVFISSVFKSIGKFIIVKNLKEHKDEKVRESASAVLTTIEEMPLER
jgi:hypothetical protein